MKETIHRYRKIKYSFIEVQTSKNWKSQSLFKNTLMPGFDEFSELKSITRHVTIKELRKRKKR